jgi:hypothetical protein
MLRRRYKEYIIRVFEKDTAGNLIPSIDGGGVFIDKKSKMQCLFLQKGRVGLSSNKIPFIINAQGKKEVYVYKAGERNFRFIHLTMEIDKITFTVGDEDLNQALIAYERADKTYLRGWLEKFMPYIVIGVVMVIFLIAFTYSMQQWEKAAEHFANLASSLDKINRTTTIISS